MQSNLLRRLPTHLNSLSLHELRQAPECRSLLFSATQMTQPTAKTTTTTKTTITTEQIQKLCKLARLAVPKQVTAVEKLKKDLSDVISCLNQLPQEIDPNVEPTYSPLQLYGRNNHLSQRWRQDEAVHKIPPKDLLKHAAFTKANCFIVQTKLADANSPQSQQEEEF